jgi:DNA-binding winged helix-turn-helix (wHTH) protein
VIYRFGEHELDLRRVELRRGGGLLKLEPRVFKVLSFLVEHHDRVVSKGELLERFWPGEYVDDSAVARSIMAARRALGDGRSSQDLIKTLRGHGYRFLADVSVTLPSEDSLAESSVTPPVEPVVAATPTRSEFVGRAEELAQLESRLLELESGSGFWVHLSGPQGIGKTRLLSELCARRSVPRDWSWGTCSPETALVPYGPWCELLRRAWGLHPGLPLPATRRRASDALERLGVSTATRGVMLALLGLDSGETLPPERYADALRHVVQRQTRGTVIVIEGVGWIDASSRRLLLEFASDVETGSVALITTSREAEWTLAAPYAPSVLALGPLSPEDSLRVIEAARVRQALPEPIAQRMIERGGGNPLFLGELGRAIERERVAVDAPLLESIGLGLAARLSALSPLERELLGDLAAWPGRSAEEWLADAADPSDVSRALERLAAADLVDRDAGGVCIPHRAVRDAALEASAEQRRSRHSRTAAALERRGAAPFVIATQLAEAGEYAQARAAFRRAGERALVLSAYHEAVDLLVRGRLLPIAEPDEELDRLLAQAASRAATGCDPSARASVEKGLELCVVADGGAHAFSLLMGHHQLALAAGRGGASTALEGAVRAVASSSQNPVFALWADVVSGTGALLRGEFGPARLTLAAAQARYDPQRHRSQALRHGNDPGLLALAGQAWMSWFAGDPVLALEQQRESLVLARALAHPMSVLVAHALAGALAHMRGDTEGAQNAASAVRALSQEHRVAGFARLAELLHAWAEPDESAAELATLVLAREDAGDAWARPQLLGLAAEALIATGARDAAGELLETAARALETAERYYAAEILRLQGRVHEVGGETRLAAALYERALSVAHEQGALPFELRATLALLAVTRERSTVLRRLASICASFAPGAQTPELSEARALLSPQKEH